MESEEIEEELTRFANKLSTLVAVTGGDIPAERIKDMKVSEVVRALYRNHIYLDCYLTADSQAIEQLNKWGLNKQ